MMQKSVILHFSSDLVDKPIVNYIIKNFDVELNILQARITPEEDGTMFLLFKGETENLKKAFDYLDSIGVKTIFPHKKLAWYEDKCTHCGACVGQCLSKAFYMEPITRKVIFEEKQCIACELCIPACPFKAIASVSEHLLLGEEV